jgi:probable HAF family extracellular repeat protein
MFGSSAAVVLKNDAQICAKFPQPERDDMQKITRFVSIGIAASGFLFTLTGKALTAAPPPTPPQVSPLDLGTLGGIDSFATAINDNGMVVGYSSVADGATLPFAWTPTGGMISLGSLGQDAYALAVNANGMVVGYGYTPDWETEHAFVWTQAGGMVDLDGRFGNSHRSMALAVNANGMVVGLYDNHTFVWTQEGGLVHLGTLGGSYSVAYAINDNGMVVGYSTTPGNSSHHAFVWTQVGGMVDLGTLGGANSNSVAYDINGSGMVAGTSSADDNIDRAFVWSQSGGLIDLGTLGGSSSNAWQINDTGMVIGRSLTSGDTTDHAYVWTQNGGMTDLGTLGGIQSSPHAINNNGLVVGESKTAADTSQGFVWTDGGGMIALDTLGAWPSSASAVNNGGLVVGYSATADGTGYRHATLWVIGGSDFNTPQGDNVGVQFGDTTLTFDHVSTAGDTTVTPIDPATIGEVPSGFAVSELVAYEVTTTATFTGAVTIGFTVPGPISEADFNSFIILHNENGSLVDVTASSPPRDYSTLRIYATTTSLSAFYLVRTNLNAAPLFDQSKAYKLNSTIPIKIQLLNAANANVSSWNTVVTVRDLRLVGGTEAAEVADAGNANPDSNFRYDATIGGTGGYIFNLSTKSLIAGKYILSFYSGSNQTFFNTVSFEVK